MATANIGQVARDAYGLCETADSMLQERMRRHMSMARQIFLRRRITESSETTIWQNVKGSPYRMNLTKVTELPWEAHIPALTTLAEAPMRVAFPPKVPANIMATKTGRQRTGQSEAQMLGAMSAGFFAPTRTGGFGESLGNAMKGMVAASADEEAQKIRQAQMRLQLGQAALGVQREGEEEARKEGLWPTDELYPNVINLSLGTEDDGDPDNLPIHSRGYPQSRFEDRLFNFADHGGIPGLNGNEPGFRNC
jgi:hypothetical protein